MAPNNTTNNVRLEMKEKASLTKRAPRCISKSAKHSGAMASGGLGSASKSGTAYFPCSQRSKKDNRFHTCRWIPGDVIEVCTLCGKTRKKNAQDEAPLDWDEPRNQKDK
jgi:hypothetical protein